MDRSNIRLMVGVILALFLVPALPAIGTYQQTSAQDEQEDPRAQRMDLLEAVLTQIKNHHTGLLEGLGDVGLRGAIVRQGDEIRIGRLRFQFQNGLSRREHEKDSTHGGETKPPANSQGEILIRLDIDSTDTHWKMKRIVFHEIVHACMFSVRQSGLWTETGTLDNVNFFNSNVRPIHEAIAYVTHLRLLQKLMSENEFAGVVGELREQHAKDVFIMNYYLNRAFKCLEKLRKSHGFWKTYGAHLHALFHSNARFFIKKWLYDALSRRDGRSDRYLRRLAESLLDRFNKFAERARKTNEVIIGGANDDPALRSQFQRYQEKTELLADELIAEVIREVREEVAQHRELEERGTEDESSDAGDDIKYSVSPLQSADAMVWTEPGGVQALAALDRTFEFRDIGALRDFHQQLGEHIANLEAGIQDLPEMDLNRSAAEIQINDFRRVWSISDAIFKAAEAQRTSLTQAAEKAKDGTDVIKGLYDGFGQDIAEETSEDDLFAMVDEIAFQERVAQVVALTTPASTEPEPTAGVVTFNLFDPDRNEPISNVTPNTTLNITWQVNGDQQIDVVSVDDKGEAETKRPQPDARLSGILIGNDDYQEGGRQANIGEVAARFFSALSGKVHPHVARAIQELTPDEQEAMITCHVVLGTMPVFGQEPDAEQIRGLSRAEIYSLARIGFYHVNLMLGPRDAEFVGDVVKRMASGTDGLDGMDAAARDKLGTLYAALDKKLEENPGLTKEFFDDLTKPSLTRDGQTEEQEDDVQQVAVPARMRPKYITIETGDTLTKEDLEEKLRQTFPKTVYVMTVDEHKEYTGGIAWLVRISPRPDLEDVHLPEPILQSIVDRISKQPWSGGAQKGNLLEGDAQGPDDPHYQSRGTWEQEYHDQWALRRVGFIETEGDKPSAWPAGWPKVLTELKPSIVAVVGSGVDWTHPELLGQMWVNMDEYPNNGIDDDGNGYVDDLIGWNFRDNTNDVMDYGGHDTHVAGVIAARWNNDRGIAGINPQAKVMALKVADFRARADSIAVSRAIFYAVDNGARVVNVSYSGEAFSRIEQRAIDYAVARGVLVVASAGNKAVDAAEVALAGNPGLLTVAGTTLKDTRAKFSNWGQPIDLAAPCMDILSLRARETDFLLYVGETPNYVGGTGIVGKAKELYRASGTSFATPIVAGTASLLFSHRPELTAEQVRRMLLMSADDIEARGWDQYTGAGLLNAAKARTADPDYYFFTRIAKVTPVRRDGQLLVEVRGQAEGSEFKGLWLQKGFGEEPERDAWTTLKYSKEPVADGVLGTIPAGQFDRPGTWTLRVLVRDGRELVKSARATLNLK